MSIDEKMKKDLANKINDFNVNLAYIQDLITVYNIILDFNQEVVSKDFILVSTCGLYDSFIISLARLYDKSESTETIPNLLKKCIKNSHLINNDEYIQKLNCFNDKLITDEYISDAVKIIGFRRDKIYAHNDKELFGRKIKSDKSFLPMYKIWALVSFSKEVLSYLSDIFDVNIRTPVETGYLQSEMPILRCI